MKIELMNDKDINAWLALAVEVEPLFGPMAGEESFQRAIAETVAARQAFCVRRGNGLAGVIAVCRWNNAVEWLAVSARERGKGCGKALLAYALATLDPSRPVTVQTFAAECAAGAAARRLYVRAGFAEVEKAGLNPAGVPTVIMLRAPERAGNADKTAQATMDGSCT
jgi:GNAT superfamily N-acetyltransferase